MMLWRNFGAGLAVGTLLLGGVACEKVSSENIERWKATVKGPGKLVDAVSSSDVDPALRAQAAAALVEIEMGDKVDDALTKMPAAERSQVTEALVPLYARQLESAPQLELAEARDGLFSIRQYATPEVAAQIDKVLLAHISKELEAGRPIAGSHSLAKMAEVVGAPLVQRLAAAMGDSRVNHGELAQIIDASGDEPAREEASKNLAALARKLDPLPPGIYLALGQLGGDAAVAFLKERIEKGSMEDAVRATQALQQRKNPALLDYALKVASDPKAHGNVREEMFGLLEACCGAKSVDGLVGIIRTSPEELVRYRAYEAAIAAGKAAAIQPALEAFPDKSSFKPRDVEDYLVRDIEKLGAKTARPALLQTLSSQSPLARLTAVLALNKLGRADDAGILRKLGRDQGRVNGFPGKATVGQEAVRVAASLSAGDQK